MTPVDINRIKPGDEVTVRGIVSRIRGGKLYFRCDAGDESITFFYAADIVSHTPAAKPLGIGDRVRFKHGPTVRGYIRALHENRAWVEFDGVGLSTATLLSLEPVDE